MKSIYHCDTNSIRTLLKGDTIFVKERSSQHCGYLVAEVRGFSSGVLVPYKLTELKSIKDIIEVQEVQV